MSDHEDLPGLEPPWHGVPAPDLAAIPPTIGDLRAAFGDLWDPEMPVVFQPDEMHYGWQPPEMFIVLDEALDRCRCNCHAPGSSVMHLAACCERTGQPRMTLEDIRFMFARLDQDIRARRRRMLDNTPEDSQ